MQILQRIVQLLFCILSIACPCFVAYLKIIFYYYTRLLFVYSFKRDMMNTTRSLSGYNCATLYAYHKFTVLILTLLTQSKYPSCFSSSLILSSVCKRATSGIEDYQILAQYRLSTLDTFIVQIRIVFTF